MRRAPGAGAVLCPEDEFHLITGVRLLVYWWLGVLRFLQAGSLDQITYYAPLQPD